MDSSRVEAGKKLKKAREKRGLTQADVAEKAGMNTNYYASIEHGEVNASLEKLQNHQGFKNQIFRYLTVLIFIICIFLIYSSHVIKPG